MTNPFLRRTDRHGQTVEKRLKRQGVKLTPASGALEGAKSDGVKHTPHHKFRVESKATVHDSISLKKEWLEKITKEALDTGCIPLLVVTFCDGSGATKESGSWAIVPTWVVDDLR